jgi:inhibitor of KinA
LERKRLSFHGVRVPIKKPRMTVAPLGDCALVVTLGGEPDPVTLQRVRALAGALHRARIPGLIDVVPAYATVAVYYDPVKTVGPEAGPFERMSAAVLRCAAAARVSARRLPRKALSDRLVEIPVCYGGPFGPDLEEVAQLAKLTPAQVISRHSQVEYTVLAIGFSPGFPYLGGLPDRLRTPRRATPRQFVPMGSVAIGGDQTGVYPVSTPGGWNLIGRTPSLLFRAEETPPALLNMGDRVKFRPISAEDFALWK